MCIAIAKFKGINRPTNQIFEICFENNPDGAGFSYEKNGTVYIEKGFMVLENFIKRIEELDKQINVKETPFLYHFRIGTQGGNTPENTHPFAVDESDKMLTKNVRTDMSMIHNGIIQKTSGYTYSKKYKHLSDTQIYVKDFLSQFKKDFGIDFIKKNSILNVIEDELGSGKFAFLDKKGNITLLGNWVEHEGVKYSNYGYEPSKYFNVGGVLKLKDRYCDTTTYKYINGYEQYFQDINELEEKNDFVYKKVSLDDINLIFTDWKNNFLTKEKIIDNLLEYGFEDSDCDNLYIDVYGILYVKETYIDGKERYIETDIYVM